MDSGNGGEKISNATNTAESYLESWALAERLRFLPVALFSTFIITNLLSYPITYSITPPHSPIQTLSSSPGLSWVTGLLFVLVSVRARGMCFWLALLWTVRWVCLRRKAVLGEEMCFLDMQTRLCFSVEEAKVECVLEIHSMRKLQKMTLLGRTHQTNPPRASNSPGDPVSLTHCFWVDLSHAERWWALQVHHIQFFRVGLVAYTVRVLRTEKAVLGEARCFLDMQTWLWFSLEEAKVECVLEIHSPRKLQQTTLLG